MIGAGGALWGACAMISQGMTLYQDRNLLNEKHYFIFAITCACIGFTLGSLEMLRVLGKTLILDEAEKIRIAMYTFEQSEDPQVKALVQKIGSLLRGRPDKNAIGELEYITTKLQQGMDLPQVLSDYAYLLSTKVQQETLRNPIINAWRNRVGPNEKTVLISYS